MLTTDILLTSLVLERLLFINPLWRLRKWFLVLIIAVITLAHILLLIDRLNLITGLLLVVGIFRVISLLRIIEARMQEQYLRRTLSRTSYWLAAFVIILGLVWTIATVAPSLFVSTEILMILAVSQAAAAIFLLIVTRRTIQRTAYSPSDKFYADKDLPTVTVAIPARNETPDLSSCLELVIASDYPKLEILVLDDCSQDNTSDVIKQFAQDGVRFIHGTEPKDTWLAKNQAYAQLERAATGDYLVFCGVDTRIQPGTIRALVLTSLNRKKDMICVVPRRGEASLLASLIQPMRYWWELALPRRLTNRPAVLSSFWLIKRRILDSYGGFEAVSRSVVPEAYFARHLVVRDAYSFIRSSGDLGVLSSKSFSEQLDRAVRLRYPEAHRRIELVLLLGLTEFTLLLLPFAFIIAAVIVSNLAVFLLAIVSSACLLITHDTILRKTSLGHPIAALFTFPLIILTEIGLGLYSMYKYEFSVVDWKGRNICLPVMHRTSQSLPNSAQKS